MSHFTTVVIGENVDEQMAPFDLNLEIDEEFFEAPLPEDRRKFVLKAAAKDGVDANATEAFSAWLSEASDDEMFLRDGELWERSMGNLRAKWDWYVVGGRWKGFFPVRVDATPDPLRCAGTPSAHELLRAALADPSCIPALLNESIYEGSDVVRDIAELDESQRADMLAKLGPPPNAREGDVADIIRLGDIDFERARSEELEGAREEFGVWKSIVEQHQRPRPWSEFASKLRAAEDRDVSDARYEKLRRQYTNEFQKQPAVVAADQDDRLGFELGEDCPVELYGYDLDGYLRRRANRALVPFAIVKDGKWHAHGEITSFGGCNPESEKSVWDEFVHDLYATLPGHTRLTLLDCHW